MVELLHPYDLSFSGFLPDGRFSRTSLRGGVAGAAGS
jgi:hypothetical protein